MQQIILTCDLCAAAKVRSKRPRYAVAALDVCHAHFLKYGPKPRKRGGRKPATVEVSLATLERKRKRDREQKRAKKQERVNAEPKKKRERAKTAPWEARQTTILAQMPTVGWIGSGELQRRVVGTGTMTATGAFRVAMRMLRQRGLVVMKGGRSRSQYARSTPAERATA